MGKNDSNIIEVKVFDNTFTLFLKGKAKLKNKKEMNELNESLESKVDIKIVKKSEDWFK